MILSCSSSSLYPSFQSPSNKTPRAKTSPPSDHPPSRVNANVTSRSSYGSLARHESSRRCGRRRLFIEAPATSLLPTCSSNDPNYKKMLEKVRPPRPDWYEELYALALNTGAKAYEAEIAGYKSELFANLKGKAQKVLEIGVGTGPNLRYYAGNEGVQVFGVDPNGKMEKYAKAAAVAAGLPLSNFEFTQAVVECLPLADASVDAVVGTLVLCSVKDVKLSLQEVKRVLKPGGLYLFVEHVAAKERPILRFTQRILDPLQQRIADGCHLRRETGKHISEAGFSDLKLSTAFLSKAYFLNPHVYGIACK